MPGIAAGPYFVVDGERKLAGQVAEGGGVAVDQLADADTAGVCGEHVLEGIVVGAGLEPDRAPASPVVPGQDVGLDELKGVADMRLAVDVGNRRRDVDRAC